MRVGGVLLCGGKSTRMGTAKALLPFGQEVMLQRVARLLAEVVSPIVVVASSGQLLPECSVPITVVRDKRPERGPLEGLRAGLAALAPLVDAAYVSSVDVPFLIPAFLRQMISRLGDADIAVPVEYCDGALRYHPLAAVYRTHMLPVIEQQLCQDQLRLSMLFATTVCNLVPLGELRAVDPQLGSLRNLNSPADYAAALVAAGLRND